MTTTLATLAEFKSHLRMPATADAVEDPRLQSFLNAATAVVENICGPINTTPTLTELHDGGNGSRTQITLRQRPVLSITSVTEYFGNGSLVLAQVATPAAATAYCYTLEQETGTLTRRVAPGIAYPFAFGVANVVVVYTAGFAVVPDNVHLAALLQAAHLYHTTQQGGRPGFNGSAAAEDGYGGTSYAIPNRVRELLAPNMRIPGIA